MNELSNNEIPTPTRRDRASLGWFGLGVLVGAVAAVGLLMLTGVAAPSAAGTTDLTAIRNAAREGAKDALLSANTGITTPLSLSDIRDAAKQGAQDALANNQDSAAGAQAAEPTAAPIDTSSITTRPSNTQGDNSATVTLIEYSDFQCPFCKRFHDSIMTRIITDYVKTGKVKLSYKNYAFLGDESRWAAQAAECAADQGKFWEMHELLFARQQSENSGAFSKENLINLAKEIKVDSAKFTECVNQDKTLERVQEDISEGNRIGVRGTPSFLLNGKLIVGAQPYETFKAAIDAALTKK